MIRAVKAGDAGEGGKAQERLSAFKETALPQAVDTLDLTHIAKLTRVSDLGAGDS